MRYELIVEHDYLRIEVADRDTRDDVYAVLRAVTAEIRARGKKSILICAPHASPLSLLDLYVFARYALKAVHGDCKVAFLYNLAHVSELSEFMKAIGEGRRLKLAVFRTVTDAMRWFGEHQTLPKAGSYS
jgi:hypothetical protein